MASRRKPAARPARRAAPGQAAPATYLLRLYVAGTTQRSVLAIANARKFCEEHLGGLYQLEVIDVFQRPALAREEQIIAVPTLVRRLPPPLRKLVGDLSNSSRILIGLDLKVPGST